MRMISAYCAERSRAARLRLLSAIRHLPHDTSGPAPGCWSTRVAGSLGRAEPLDLQLVHRVLVGDRLVDGVEELGVAVRSEEHTSELQSLMRISYAVFCLKKKKKNKTQ